jgi:hypothetical protein
MIRHCLRAVAIGLIIFPEPVTTAVGIAILSATMAFPRYRRLESFENIEELIYRSFKIPETRRFGRYLPEDKPAVFHELKRKSTSQSVTVHDDPAIPKHTLSKLSKKLSSGQIKAGAKLPQKNPCLEANLLANCASNKWFDNRRVPEKVLHHTLKTSLP